MHRCLELAVKGTPSAFPNPLVGSVIVKDGRILGEGFHQAYGEAHAEVNAVASVANPEDFKEATIYVSLEPCAHHGKTPPCSDLIIQKGIPNVVVAIRDPFHAVDGKGIERLKNHGVKVEVGVLEKEAFEINRKFFTLHQKKRPYITLKWAQTADGFIDRNDAQENRGPNWITQPETKQLVHKWRSENQAILVGATTALVDNPSLTVRDYPGNSPLRILLDPERIVPLTHQLFNGEGATWVLSNNDLQYGNEKVIPFDGKNAINSLLDIAYAQGIQSIFVEGGAATLNSFIESNLWDEAMILEGDVLFHYGLPAPKLKDELLVKKSTYGKDRVHYFRNR